MRSLFTGVVAALLLSALAVAPARAQHKDDGEQSAEPARLAMKGLMLDVAAAGKRVVAVGDRGIVLLSDDRGESWQQAREVPTRNLLTGVCFADAKHGIAVGHDEVILITQDGGMTWKRTHYAPEAQQPLLDVWCAESGMAIAVGAYGACYTSDDGGLSWKARRLDAKPVAARAEASKSTDEYEDDLGGEPHLNAIVSATPGRFYIAGEAGHLYRSDDSGASWVELESPYEGSFFGVLPLGRDSVLAYGLRGHLFRSDDAGKTWSRIETGSVAMLNDAARLGEHGVVIVGLSGALLESRDDARHFELRQQSGRKGLSALVAFDTGNEVIIAGEDGVKRVSLARDAAP